MIRDRTEARMVVALVAASLVAPVLTFTLIALAGHPIPGLIVAGALVLAGYGYAALNHAAHTNHRSTR